jgi:hypothetical protein
VAAWLSAPVLGCVYVGGVEGGDGGAAEEAEGAFDVGAEDFEGADYAGVAGGGQAVGVGTAYEDSAGAEADGLYDVTATADAAIHQDFGAAVDGGDDFGKRADRGIDGIELTAAVVGDDDGGDAFIHGAARVVSCEQAFHDDWARPDAADPAQVVPGDGGVGERGGDVHQLHRPFARDGDVFELGDSPIGEKRGEPARVREKLREKRELGEERVAQELLHAVARIAFAHSGDWRVHGDDKSGVASAVGTIDAAFGCGAASEEIQLIPRGAFGGGFHVFQLVAGDGGKDVACAGFARGFGGGNFSAGMHQSAVADGCEQAGKGQIKSDDAHAEITFVEGDGVARAKQDVVEGAGIFAERGFVVGAAIEVIENGTRETALGEAAKILDVDYAGRAEGVRSKGHGKYITEKRPGEAMRNCSGGACKKKALAP